MFTTYDIHTPGQMQLHRCRRLLWRLRLQRVAAIFSDEAYCSFFNARVLHNGKIELFHQEMCRSAENKSTMHSIRNHRYQCGGHTRDSCSRPTSRPCGGSSHRCYFPDVPADPGLTLLRTSDTRDIKKGYLISRRYVISD